MDRDLGALRRDLLDLARKEFRKHRSRDTRLVEAFRGASKASRELSLVIVPSDKTKRNVVLKSADYLAMGDEFIKKDASYRRVLKSHAAYIEKEANKKIELLKNSLRIPENAVKRLKVNNSKPANITFTIKDHKKSKRTATSRFGPLPRCTGHLLTVLIGFYDKSLRPPLA